MSKINSRVVKGICIWAGIVYYTPHRLTLK